MDLYHYYDSKIGPFRSLSDLSVEEANKVLSEIKTKTPNVQCAKRHSKYMEDRHYYENVLRHLFIKKQGKIERLVPYYMVVEQSPWISSWFDNCDYIKIPVKEFDLNTLSFTYGDSHPTFSPNVNDGKEYRKKIYTYNEILRIIDKYGLPQEWNGDGKYGPERYIEVQVWSDKVISKYR